MDVDIREDIGTGNVRRRQGPVYTDTIYLNTPALFGDETSGQISDVYGAMMKSEKMSVNILQGNVRQERGSMDKLITIVQRTLSSFGQDL